MVPGISNLMSARVTYLQSLPEFLSIPPSITSVNESNSTPTLDDFITITSDVFNADSVYLGYRYSTSNKFIRIPMFDDGLHGDLSAGDNIFGVEIQASALLIQYYIYAENSAASMFSPERAEHEFYTIQTQLNLPIAGQVVINEFLSMNINGKMNEYGVRADWLEIYNNSDSEISLYGLYLTDDFEKKAKYGFPKNTTIPAGGFLTLWADEEDATTNYLHCNFRLSEGGEQLMLSDGFTVILDSLTFGSQLDDVTTGRCPNGNGNFQFIGKPTFNNFNCFEDSAGAGTPWGNITLFPNPTIHEFSFSTLGTLPVDEIKIVNCLGQVVKIVSLSGNNYVNTQKLTTGIYFLEFYNKTTGDRKRLKMVKAGHGK